MVLVRIMDWVKESAMLFRLAVSAVHAARSTRRMTDGATTATRIEMTASTPMISINVQPAQAANRSRAPNQAKPLECDSLLSLWLHPRNDRCVVGRRIRLLDCTT